MSSVGAHRLGSNVDDGGRPASRERLVHAIETGVDGPLTVIAAPPGYDKSPLVQDWAAQHDRSPISWVTVRPGDPPAPPGAAQASWRHALIDTPEGALVVVDATRASPVQTRDLELVLARGQVGAHVVLVRRGPWSAGQAQNGSEPPLVLRAEDLAYTAAEAARSIEQRSGRAVDLTHVHDLVARTEGWPLAVRVAGAQLRLSSDPATALERLGGDERHIAAFLAEEVLGRYSPRVGRFLIKLSALDVLTAESCRSLTGESNAWHLLRRLESDGAFVRRLDPAGDEFVLHRAFREFLRSEVAEVDPTGGPDLLVAASQVHADRGEVASAADCLIEARRWDELGALIDREGPAQFERGNVREVLRWIDAVWVTSDEHRVAIGLRRACALTMLGESRQAEEVIRELDRRLTAEERLVVDAFRSSWAFSESAAETVLVRSDAALAAFEQVEMSRIPDVLGVTSPSSLRLILQASRGRALWYLRDHEGARRTLIEAASVSDGYPPWLVATHGTLALMEAWSGNLNDASRHARESLAIATTHGLTRHPCAMDARAAMAHVHRERNEHESADTLTAELDATPAHLRRPARLAVHVVERACWHLAAGRPDVGLAELEPVLDGAEVGLPEIVTARLRAVEVRLLAATKAMGMADQRIAASDEPLPPEMCAIATQVAIDGNDLESARRHLAAWSRWTLDHRSTLELDLLSAVLEMLDGNRGAAVRRARLVADAAEVDGHVRLFVDLGKPVARLLRLVQRTSPSPYLSMLVDATHAVGESHSLGLSQRELEIVRYLPTPQTSAEIAATLFISLNTLKSHLRSIYRKLGVSQRRDAIARVEELGLA